MYINVKKWSEEIKGLPPAEGRVSGTLRGGFIKNNQFYTNSGNGCFVVPINEVTELKILTNGKWREVTKVEGSKVYLKTKLKVKG
jgi:hypothetical protein